jgi:uncharacterized RDD family membrane protein YckC
MQEFKNAGFWHRYFSTVLDYAMLSVFIFFPIFLYSFIFNSTDEISDLNGMYLALLVSFICIVFSLPLLIAYNTYFTYKYAGTLGKLITGLRVVDFGSLANIDKKRAFHRSLFGYSFSAVFFGYGYLNVFKSIDRQAFHDILFETRVISKGLNLGRIFLGIIIILLPALILAISLANISRALTG